jgi:transposase-like protein
VQLPRQSPFDARDRVILTCINAGLSPETIARALKISRVTVWRRVKAISDRITACKAG